MRILVTGGAGFIGSNLVQRLLNASDHHVVNIDKLTYAADTAIGTIDHPRYHFIQADIGDLETVRNILSDHDIDAIMHLAAESHVDRSIDGPGDFLQTNVVGTFTLLQAALSHWRQLPADRASRFRFHHISTDEVYGDLDVDDPAFTETTPYHPSSPYSASKAASDHFVRAWQRTYGLPALVTNCSNNYGPRQFPEKLIPLIILNAISGKSLPVYGDGGQIRDWLHVDDHADALITVLENGVPGETYNVGGRSERRNIDVVHSLCRILEDEHPDKPTGVAHYTDLIVHVTDRPGHDRRYAIDDRKLAAELHWTPARTFEQGLRETVRWYLDNLDWCRRVKDGGYDGQRLGTFAAGAAQ